MVILVMSGGCPIDPLTETINALVEAIDTLIEIVTEIVHASIEIYYTLDQALFLRNITYSEHYC